MHVSRITKLRLETLGLGRHANCINASQLTKEVKYGRGHGYDPNYALFNNSSIALLGDDFQAIRCLKRVQFSFILHTYMKTANKW